MDVFVLCGVVSYSYEDHNDSDSAIDVLHSIKNNKRFDHVFPINEANQIKKK